MMRTILLFCICLAVGKATLYARSPSSKRITGGEDAEEGAWPWQLSLIYNGQFVCGGVLIERDNPQMANRAITAVHCVANRNIFWFNVRAGSTDRGLGRMSTVWGEYSHPSYNDGSSTYANDISVLYLNEDFNTMEGNISAIPRARLPDGMFAGENCWITGWGHDQRDLQQAQTTVLSVGDCQAQLGACGCAAFPAESNVCVRDEDGVSGLCTTDAGSPLSCLDDEGEWILVGMASWSISGGGNTCVTSFPSVYTRISSHEQWLNTHL